MFATQPQVIPTSHDTCYPSYCEGKSPSCSYLYNSADRKNYHFEDPDMAQVSHQPSFKIKGEEVIFTFNKGPAIRYGGCFIHSMKEFVEKIKLTDSPNLTDKIKKINDFFLKDNKPC